MYATINNLQIYYQKVGKGKDLVLLHGWQHDVSTWWTVVDQLKDDFTLWLIDLPGFGRSEINKDFTISDYAEVVEEFIKQQNINRPHLIGHSLGGNISIKLTIKDSDLTDRLILEDSSGIRPQKTLVRTFLVLPAAKLFRYFFPNFLWKDRVRNRLYRRLESDYINAGALKGTLTNILAEDLAPDLAKVKAETLIIWGENDRSVPLKSAKKMYQEIENSRLEIIEGAKHSPHIETPQRFVYWVKNFLT